MEMDSNRPIGIFDSGLGGLSVAAEIHTLLPEEALIYYGDSRRAPYGVRSRQEVKAFCFEICDHLMTQRVKAIVVACNTATSAAIAEMRRRYPIPIIGMEPALKPAVEQTETGAVAVLATELTLREAKFQTLLEKYRENRVIHSIPCPELVQAVEGGLMEGPEAEALIRSCLGVVELDSLSAVVLGCTHYVFLKPVFRRLAGPGIRIVDGNRGTALQLKRVLGAKGALARGSAEGILTIENSAGPEWVVKSWQMYDAILPIAKEEHHGQMD